MVGFDLHLGSDRWNGGELLAQGIAGILAIRPWRDCPGGDVALATDGRRPDNASGELPGLGLVAGWNSNNLHGGCKSSLARLGLPRCRIG